ncbi:MAG: VWA domain-containing protein [Sandaracinus sp.]
MRLRLGRRSGSSLSVGVLAVLGAIGAIVVLRSPEATAATPTTTPREATPPAPAATPPPAPGDAQGRVELDGPAVDGVLAFGESALLASGSSEVFAELRLEGLADGAAAPRRPVALAVVLDHSGSMAGTKLVQAEEAVVSLLERMHDEDYLSFVVYDDGAEVVQALAPVAALRASLPARVRGIPAGGGTNIPLGLDLGVGTLGQAPTTHVRRVVLLSDGLDGSGEPLGAVQARIAARADERTTTSALGIGIDYDEHFMTSVAESGRGNYGFLEREEMLAPFLARELEQATATVADDVVVELTLPADLSFVAAHGASASVSGQRVRLPIGTLFAGERRKAVLHFTAAPGNVGALAAASVHLAYRTSDGTARGAEGVASLLRVATAEELAAHRDQEIWADAYATVLDARQDQALAAWRAGRRDEALRLTDDNLAALAAVEQAAPAARPMLAQRRSARAAERSMYEHDDAASEAGRAGGLARRAERVDLAEAF